MIYGIPHTHCHTYTNNLEPLDDVNFPSQGLTTY